MSKMDKALAVLLRDFGYRVEGALIIQNGIRGYTSERIFGRCRGLFDATEQLIPIVHDDEFFTRYARITGQAA